MAHIVVQLVNTQTGGRNMAKSYKMVTRVNTALKEKTKEVADSMNISVSAIIRIAITEYLLKAKTNIKKLKQ